MIDDERDKIVRARAEKFMSLTRLTQAQALELADLYDDLPEVWKIRVHTTMLLFSVKDKKAREMSHRLLIGELTHEQFLHEMCEYLAEFPIH